MPDPPSATPAPSSLDEQIKQLQLAKLRPEIRNRSGWGFDSISKAEFEQARRDVEAAKREVEQARVEVADLRKTSDEFKQTSRSTAARSRRCSRPTARRATCRPTRARP